jgi:hypothetical protein
MAFASRPTRIAVALASAAMLAWSGCAAAQQVRLTKLSSVTIGTVTNLEADVTRAQNVCAFSSASGARYSVRGSGSGTGGAFTLASGSSTMAYEVQWSGQSGQVTGTALTAGLRSPIFTSTAANQLCTSGPATTASLILVVRAAALSSATAGAYSGTLTLILAPE